MHDTSARNPDNWPVRPAPFAASFVAALTLLACAAAWLNGLPAILQIPIAVGALALGTFTIRRLLNPAVRRLKVDGLRVRAQAVSGARHEGVVTNVPFVSPFFVGIRWRAPGMRLPRTIGIFREQLDRDDFRRLCATLRQQDER